ncbi:MAG: hypothetical protein U0269_35510 [Polyangiales bacterium]
MVLGMISGRGAGRSVLALTVALSVSASGCATTQSQSNGAQSELNAESEANARASTSTSSNTGASRAPAQNAALANYRRLAQRESTTVLTERAVHVGEDFHSVVLGASDAEVTNSEGGHSVSVAIGASQPMQCIVYDSIVDPANSVRRVFENVRRAMARIAIESIDSGFVGESPYIEGRFLYVTSGPNAGAGMLKVRSALVADRSVLCMHDEVGYVQTFNRAMEPMLRSVALSQGGANYIVTVGETNLGFTAIRFREEGGEIIETSLSGSLAARSELDLTASDDVVVERYSRDGVIRSMMRLNDENGTITQRQWERDGQSHRYRFEGTHLGRPLQGVVTATAPLRAGTPAAAEAFRTLMGPRAPASVELQSISSRNPLTLDTDRYSLHRRVDATHAWITVQTGDRTIRALMGPAGLPDEFEFVGATATVRARRAGRP